MKKFIGSVLVLFMVAAFVFPSLTGSSGLLAVKALESEAEEKTASGADAFVDVPKDCWYYDAVDYVVNMRVFSGTSENTFEPETNMTRAMFVRMLANFSGADLTQYRSMPFSDVNIESWYGTAVAWAEENGLVKGVSETDFSPDAEITREQMCTLIVRFADFAGIEFAEYDEETRFADDSEISGFAEEAVYRCQKHKLVLGIGDGNFGPLGTATRSQAATIMMNLMEGQDDNYVDIACREVDKYIKVYPAFEVSNLALSLKIPEDWTLTKNGGTGYDIMRDGKRIGTLSSSVPTYAGPPATVVSTDEKKTDDLLLKENLLKYFINGKVAFKYQHVFEFLDGSGKVFVMESDYAEVSRTTLTRIKNALKLEAIKSLANLGSIPMPQGKNAILILGNSFVGTSNIGTILDNLCASGGKNCNVDAISRGYASMATYAEDTSLLSRIRSGRYGIVFMCGAYSSDDVNKLEVIKKACDASNTTLVIFPAHNESAWLAESAHKQYPNTKFLYWKDEIDSLIDKGVAYSDFCIDDMHQHSKPLAGYVGAHMIYRSVFGELPPALTNAESIGLTQTYVRMKLGQYIETGELQLIDASLVYTFNNM